MKIYINTSDENVEINGETFIPGEWLHLNDDFEIDVARYPFLKSPQVVLAEKYSEINIGTLTQKTFISKLKEYHLDQFAAGIKQAEDMYKTASDPLTAQILTLTKA